VTLQVTNRWVRDSGSSPHITAALYKFIKCLLSAIHNYKDKLKLIEITRSNWMTLNLYALASSNAMQVWIYPICPGGSCAPPQYFVFTPIFLSLSIMNPPKKQIVHLICTLKTQNIIYINWLVVDKGHKIMTLLLNQRNKHKIDYSACIYLYF